MTYPEKSKFPAEFLDSMDAALKSWQIEKKRFFKLFKNLDKINLEKKCLTSTCGHSFGDHIICLLIWMEGSVNYFQALKEGRAVDFYDPEIPMLTWTNQQIDLYKKNSYKHIWDKLEKADLELQHIIKNLDEKLIFNDKNNVWTWFVWTTFGHYDVHSTELEYQDKNDLYTGLEKQWICK